MGIWNTPGWGPWFGDDNTDTPDLHISDNCHVKEYSRSDLGRSYGGPGVDRNALFGQRNFRMLDYEVFSIVILNRVVCCSNKQIKYETKKELSEKYRLTEDSIMTFQDAFL
jgi:hypothetical protein